MANFVIDILCYFSTLHALIMFLQLKDNNNYY